MGSDKEKTDWNKSEKKRLKAQYKLDKKRVNAQEKSDARRAAKTESKSKHDYKDSSAKPHDYRPGKSRSVKSHKSLEKLPWYKDPAWIRALVAVLSLIVAIIALFIMLYR